MAAKLKALQAWCRKQCEGYRDVDITDMTRSWKSGLAFCAIIHRFRPDLIDYDSLNKENVYENNKLAFSLAQEKLGIPALLDADDMVAMEVPDRLCMCTYISQYANYFQGKPQLGGPGVNKAAKRPAVDTPSSSSQVEPKRPVMAPIQSDLPPTRSARGTLPHSTSDLLAGVHDSFEQKRSYDDICAACEGKVFLVERHIDNGILYHRRCFRDKQKASSTASLRCSTNSIADTVASNTALLVEHAQTSPVNALVNASHPTIARDAEYSRSKTAPPLKPSFDIQPKTRPIAAQSPYSGSWRISSAVDVVKDRGSFAGTAPIISIPSSNSSIHKLKSSDDLNNSHGAISNNKSSDVGYAVNSDDASLARDGNDKNSRSPANATVYIPSKVQPVISTAITSSYPVLNSQSTITAVSMRHSVTVSQPIVTQANGTSARNVVLSSLSSSVVTTSAYSRPAFVGAEITSPSLVINSRVTAVDSNTSLTKSVSSVYSTNVATSVPHVTTTGIVATPIAVVTAPTATTTASTASRLARPASTAVSSVHSVGGQSTADPCTDSNKTMPTITTITSTTGSVSNFTVSISSAQPSTPTLGTNSVATSSTVADSTSGSGSKTVNSAAIGRRINALLHDDDSCIQRPPLTNRKSEPVASNLLKNNADTRSQRQSQIVAGIPVISASNGMVKNTVTSTAASVTPVSSRTGSNMNTTAVTETGMTGGSPVTPVSDISPAPKVTGLYKDTTVAIATNGSSFNPTIATTPVHTGKVLPTDKQNVSRPEFANIVLRQVNGIKKHTPNNADTKKYDSASVGVHVNHPPQMGSAVTVTVSIPSVMTTTPAISVPSVTKTVSAASTTPDKSSTAVVAPTTRSSVLITRDSTPTNSINESKSAAPDSRPATNGVTTPLRSKVHDDAADTPRSILKRNTLAPAAANVDNDTFSSSSSLASDGSKRFSAFHLKDSMIHVSHKTEGEEGEGAKPARVKSAWQVQAEARRRGRWSMPAEAGSGVNNVETELVEDRSASKMPSAASGDGENVSVPSTPHAAVDRYYKATVAKRISDSVASSVSESLANKTSAKVVPIAEDKGDLSVRSRTAAVDRIGNGLVPSSNTPPSSNVTTVSVATDKTNDSSQRRKMLLTDFTAAVKRTEEELKSLQSNADISNTSKNVASRSEDAKPPSKAEPSYSTSTTNTSRLSSASNANSVTSTPSVGRTGSVVKVDTMPLIASTSIGDDKLLVRRRSDPKPAINADVSRNNDINLSYQASTPRPNALKTPTSSNVTSPALSNNAFNNREQQPADRDVRDRSNLSPLQRVDTQTAASLVSTITKQMKRPVRSSPLPNGAVLTDRSPVYPTPIVSEQVPATRALTPSSGGSTWSRSDTSTSGSADSSVGSPYQAPPPAPPGDRVMVTTGTVSWSQHNPRTSSAEPIGSQQRKKILANVKFSFNTSDFDKPHLQARSEAEAPPPWIASRPVPTAPVQCVVPKRKVQAETWVEPVELERRRAVLDVRLRELEHIGRDLEENIRNTDGTHDEDMMLKWFELVNKKNELVRMETELVYKQQQQELEALHEEIEHELRCLTSKADEELTPSERVRVDVLLRELEHTVLERNSIVDIMEEDRQRYLLEDEEINNVLTSKFLDGKKKKKKSKSKLKLGKKKKKNKKVDLNVSFEEY